MNLSKKKVAVWKFKFLIQILDTTDFPTFMLHVSCAFLLFRSTSPGVVPSPTPPIYTPSIPRLVSSMPEVRFRQTRILGPQTEKRRKHGHRYTYFEAVKLRMAPVLFVCYRLLCLHEQHFSIQGELFRWIILRSLEWGVSDSWFYLPRDTKWWTSAVHSAYSLLMLARYVRRTTFWKPSWLAIPYPDDSCLLWPANDVRRQ